MDRQSVVGALKATGSRDADVLHSQRNELLSAPEAIEIARPHLHDDRCDLHRDVILAIVGIPCVIRGWWCWRFGKHNIAAIEAGYTQYLASATH